LGSNQLKSSKIEDLTNKDWGFTALLREMVGIAFNLTIKNRHFNRQFFAKNLNWDLTIFTVIDNRRD
jgi:hypothetical protein